MIALSPLLVSFELLEKNAAVKRVYWTLWFFATIFLVIVLSINYQEIGLLLKRLAKEDFLKLRIGNDDDGNGRNDRKSRVDRANRVVKQKSSRIHATKVNHRHRK